MLDNFEGKTSVVLCAHQGQSHVSVAILCSLGNGACLWPILLWQLPAGCTNSLSQRPPKHSAVQTVPGCLTIVGGVFDEESTRLYLTL